ncbi:MAG: family 43 glycosylhydrolase [Elusimicrobia bacterium]|nr:family 43 glycosylhydrolase [Elusimicrobiota bacterium]
MADLARLRIRIGGQAPVPAGLFFGSGSGATSAALRHVDAAGGLMMTRLPIPLQEGEALSLAVERGTPVDAAYGVAAAAARPGVHLLAQFGDQALDDADTLGPAYAFDRSSTDAPPALRQGKSIRLCDAGLPGGPFYINDHTLARAPDGRWHLFGIFHHELADPLNEVDFVHARAPAGDPAGWSGNDFVIGQGTAGVALSVDRSLGETHLWAPHVAKNGNEYVMAFHSGGPDDDSQIKIAHSADLETWQRRPLKPIFTDICTARDPMLFKAGDLWVLYYTRCDGIKTRLNGVAYRTSTDLENWSEPAMALTLTKAPPLPNSGYTESPFVFERGGWYYLSATSYPVEYDATFLYRSRSPFSFGDAAVAKFKSHAAEWVEGGDDPGHGPLFITHAGWGQGGVWLSPVTGW